MLKLNSILEELKVSFNIEDIEKKINYTFKNKQLLLAAVTHRSYAHDRKRDVAQNYNERIEFLGDAVLQHIMSAHIYITYPNWLEGKMSKKRSELVCEDTLAAVMVKNGLDKYLLLGKCEMENGGKNNKALIADMAEAILGAIYLDSNFETVQKICMNLYGNIRDEVLSTDVYNTDYKTRLQEVLQKNGTVNLKYILLDTKGQDNNPVFYSGVYLEDKKLGEGYGKTKKESEQMAAKMALETL
jgi:ribonuclease-3